ncbi:putative inorganic phosphate cotransporter isoform X1 [Ostrinia furnacalis]|uniref:putative inorganic phosphate cotransporter isoform X1 n=1 Tax=Ostrinia furnacalis TaxID=93504 RepID=UPI00103EBB58|nr:putative inorganic phosphate cotransporter isoform X1 [Ostrinia furnacalis]
MKLHIKAFDAIPARLVVGIMMFFACWVNYMMRVNMSVNIIAMVPDNKNATSVKSQCEAIVTNDSALYNETAFVVTRRPRQPENVVTFDWTAQEQAYVLSGYFWGYAVTCLVGGTAAEMWGPRKVVFITMLVTSILTILSPQAARLHYLVLVAVRIVSGLASGFLFPALHALVAHWAPPQEKGKFVSALLGGAIGTVVTWSLTGPLIEKFGWDYAFYIPGIISTVWCLLWLVLVYDSPVKHPRISDSEKKYILEALGDKVHQSAKDTKIVPPFKSIFTSLPFLAMVILHYGSNWGLYFVMTAAPKFVSSALGFNLTSTGTLSSLPYLARMIFSLTFGAIGDRIVKQNVVSTTFMRKFFCLFSHVVPGLLLIALGYTGCAPILSIVLITFSMGSNGAATLTNLVNHQDLAPNFAGTLYGIANGIGNTAGFVTPLVTAHFTKDGNGFAEWRPVFITGASLYIASAVYFILFGTGETQSWNYVAPVEEERDKRPSANSTNSTDTAVTVTIPVKT